MGPQCHHKGPCKGAQGGQTYEGETDVKAEAETGEKRPQAKVLVPPETSRGRGTGPPLEPPWGAERRPQGDQISGLHKRKRGHLVVLSHVRGDWVRQLCGWGFLEKRGQREPAGREISLGLRGRPAPRSAGGARAGLATAPAVFWGCCDRTAQAGGS